MGRPQPRFPPGPKGRWPTDLLFAFQRDPLKFLTESARQYGDLVHFKIGQQQIYLVNHPDDLHQVLIRDHRKFAKSRLVQMGKRLTGEGLITSDGDLHLRQRRLIQPAFHRDRITSTTDLVVNSARELCEQWHASEILDIHREFTRLTLSIHGKALFGSDLQGEMEEFTHAISIILGMFPRLVHPLGELLWKLPLPSNRRFFHAKARLDSMVYSIIAAHRNQKNDRGDLLSLLLHGGEGADAPMTDQQVRDQVLTVLLAGYETTALALTWTWYLLAQHPEIEENLHREVDTVLTARTPTAADLPRLLYTEKIIKEALRLYPPSWVISRQVLEDYAIGGYIAPAGSTFFLSQYVMHRDPRFFPEPERFDPERWMPETTTARPRYADFAFGAGPRACIGEPFAWMLLKLITAELAQQWQMRLIASHPVQLDPRITLRPKDGVWVVLERRSRQIEKPSSQLLPTQSITSEKEVSENEK